MNYTSLGKSGLKVSRLSLGCMTYGSSAWRQWVLDEEAAFPFFKQAWEAGINFFDTADMYSNGASEEVLGRALTKLKMRREEVVIASKLFFPVGQGPNERGTSRKHVRHAIDDSLRRLGTDYIDLYQIHRYDKTTPMEETLEALTDLVRAGKVLYLGASSMAAWEFAKFLHLAERHGRARFVSMQNHYNLVYREEERERFRSAARRALGSSLGVRSRAAFLPVIASATINQPRFARRLTIMRTSSTTRPRISTLWIASARLPASAVFRMRRWHSPGSCSSRASRRRSSEPRRVST